jgi:hypothetical protein
MKKRLFLSPQIAADAAGTVVLACSLLLLPFFFATLGDALERGPVPGAVELPRWELLGKQAIETTLWPAGMGTAESLGTADLR